jgi:hypothetical protein
MSGKQRQLRKKRPLSDDDDEDAQQQQAAEGGGQQQQGRTPEVQAELLANLKLLQKQRKRAAGVDAARCACACARVCATCGRRLLVAPLCPTTCLTALVASPSTARTAHTPPHTPRPPPLPQTHTHAHARLVPASAAGAGDDDDEAAADNELMDTQYVKAQANAKSQILEVCVCVRGLVERGTSLHGHLRQAFTICAMQAHVTHHLCGGLA